MLSGGNALEKYGMLLARQSLTALTDRIPNSVLLWSAEGEGEKKAIQEVEISQKIIVRKGEVIPLDGELISEAAQIDESSLTGEPYKLDKIKGD